MDDSGVRLFQETSICQLSMLLWMRLKNSSFVQALSDKKGTLPGPMNEWFNWHVQNINHADSTYEYN